MTQFLKSIFGALVLLLVVSVTPAGAEVAVGDQAPNFELQGSDGKVYKNDQFAGKKAIVIAWFPRAFTGGCTKECKSMREDGELLRQYEVAYFTASVDDAAKNTDFAKSLDLDYPILSDPTKAVAEAFGCLNSRGLSNRWTYYIGKDGKILHIDKSVKTTSHGKDIAAKLAELGIPKK